MNEEKILYEFRLARLLVGIVILGTLSAETIQFSTPRDSDFFSRVNPWASLLLSIEIGIWAFSSRKFIAKCKCMIDGLEIGLDEGLWFVFGFWMIHVVRLGFFPQHHEVFGVFRSSWLCIYISMAIFSLGNWLLRHRFQ